MFWGVLTFQFWFLFSLFQTLHIISEWGILSTVIFWDTVMHLDLLGESLQRLGLRP